MTNLAGLIDPTTSQQALIPFLQILVYKCQV